MLKFVLIAITHLAASDSWDIQDYDLTSEDCMQSLVAHADESGQAVEWVCAVQTDLPIDAE